MDYTTEQKIICKKYTAVFSESPLDFKIGISKNVKFGVWPINGLRHKIEGDTTGWYVWAGDYSTEEDFFTPMHVEHLKEIYPLLLNYLGLAPGWRFLLADGYEDVWQDLSLLNVD